MTRWSYALVLLVVFVGHGVTSGPQRNPSCPVGESEPDLRKARRLDRWPCAFDLARLQSVEGQPQAQVLRVLGHPRWIERRADGTERWDYPWQAACCVWIQHGICTGTFYTAGY